MADPAKTNVQSRIGSSQGPPAPPMGWRPAGSAPSDAVDASACPAGPCQEHTVTGASLTVENPSVHSARQRTQSARKSMVSTIGMHATVVDEHNRARPASRSQAYRVQLRTQRVCDVCRFLLCMCGTGLGDAPAMHPCYAPLYCGKCFRQHRLTKRVSVAHRCVLKGTPSSP
jgi:hypothetical protein